MERSVTSSTESDIQMHVYKGTSRDRARVLRLLESARRSFAAFGQEDLAHLLASGHCLLGMNGDRLRAFLCATINPSAWAFLRGAAIEDGWRTDDGLAALLEPMCHLLRDKGATHLAVYATAHWLGPALLRANFERFEWIVTLERHSRPRGAAGDALPGLVTIRPVGPDDLSRLAALDHAVFAPPFQLASGELIELMVTCGYFALAQLADDQLAADLGWRLAGYACADVLGDEGQIIRLAVHPEARRQGIGSALLNSALAYCHANQASLVVINTQESNAASLKLYEEFGFRRLGRRVPLLARRL